jgi:hypothetical protein
MDAITIQQVASVNSSQPVVTADEFNHAAAQLQKPHNENSNNNSKPQENGKTYHKEEITPMEVETNNHGQ